MRTTLNAIIVRAALLVCTVLAAPMPLLAFQPPPAQEEYLPIDQLPPTEQLPGGVFVIIAYGFIWVASMLYIWSLWRRLNKVESEMQALQRRSGGSKG
jgi:CcmD family protein